jgi:hypothetical protein
VIYQIRYITVLALGGNKTHKQEPMRGGGGVISSNREKTSKRRKHRENAANPIPITPKQVPMHTKTPNLTRGAYPKPAA